MSDSNKNLTSAQKAVLSVMDQQINQINQHLIDPIAQLPESVFVGVFLPIFCGEKPIDDPQSVELMNSWYGIAGNPYRPVDVVDDKTSEILFRVPAILNNKAIDPVKGSSGKMSFRQIISGAQQLSNVSPEMSKNYLEKHLISRDLLAVDTPELKDAIQRWRDIFSRYGKAVEPASKEDPKTGSSGDGPELVFD